MFGILKREAHVQPKPGCYSNEIHHLQARPTIQPAVQGTSESTRELLKTFWIYSCEVNREQSVEPVVSTKQSADKLLAFTKMRALTGLESKKSHVAA